MSLVRWNPDDDWQASCDSCGVEHPMTSDLEHMIDSLVLDFWIVEQYSEFDGVTFAAVECEECR